MTKLIENSSMMMLCAIAFICLGARAEYTDNYFRTYSYSASPFQQGNPLYTTSDIAKNSTTHVTLSLHAKAGTTAIIATQTPEPSKPGRLETVQTTAGQVSSNLPETVNINWTGCTFPSAKTVVHSVPSANAGVIAVCGTSWTNVCGYSAGAWDSNPGVCHTFTPPSCPCGSFVGLLGARVANTSGTLVYIGGEE